MLHQGTGSSFGLDGAGRASRNDFIVKGDIRRIEKEIEAETVRLDPDDGKSLFRWAGKLRSIDALLGFKSISCQFLSFFVPFRDSLRKHRQLTKQMVNTLSNHSLIWKWFTTST